MVRFVGVMNTIAAFLTVGAGLAAATGLAAEGFGERLVWGRRLETLFNTELNARLVDWVNLSMVFMARLQ